MAIVVVAVFEGSDFSSLTIIVGVDSIADGSVALVVDLRRLKNLFSQYQRTRSLTQSMS